jgi:divalent metal cation (Fe/Co/Zn/Cd) transporter
MTTELLSAIVGSLLILVAAQLFLHARRASSTGDWVPSNLSIWGVVLALLVPVGIAIQYRFFIHRSDKPQMTRA